MTFNRVPVATYRLQFNKCFGFSDAGNIISYLKELGISDVYASPLFRAAPESTHGYDVCGFEINPNLGGSEAFEQFLLELKSSGLGLLLDIVPNHMSVDWTNAWWRDVLEKGEQSRFAKYFDVNWGARPDRKIVLPVLGDRFSEVLSRGDLKIDTVDENLVLAYFDKRFPLTATARETLKRSAVLPRIGSNPEALHELIQTQHYCLGYWRVAPHEINYRRFFDVADLVSLRVEDEEVFRETHQLVFELLHKGHITGLRIDHVDGLGDPKAYLERLQTGFRDGETSPKLFVVAEKILSDDEHLPDDWAVAGTTGYEFLVRLNGLFIAEQNEHGFTRIYGEFTATRDEYIAVAYGAKKHALETLFPGDVNSLAVRLKRIAEQTLDGFDFTLKELHQSLVELIAAFPVYRTYSRPGKDRLRAAEEQHVREAVKLAAAQRSDLAPALRFLERILRMETKSLHQDCLEFVLRFQQLTGPATAKGVEDTAFYRYNRFISLNEVGGNPGQFGTSVDDFHSDNQRRQERWPHSLLATATHDTKRGEDVRARLNVLSEIPSEWETHLRTWRELAVSLKTELNGQLAPDSNDEYFLYQTLLGSWLEFPEETYGKRIQQSVLKAIREAKLRTSWTDANNDYENAAVRFVESLLHSEQFRQSFEPFQKRIAYFGVFNSLSQLLLKVGSPGVPDFYQGTELWDFNLVDPDNRRPVDYSARRELLDKIRNRSKTQDRTRYLADLLNNPADAEIKLFVLWSALSFRARNKEIFESGAYIPLRARGEMAAHVVAFARRSGKRNVIVVAPRLPLSLVGGVAKPPIGTDVWGDTELPFTTGCLREVFSQGQFVAPYRIGQILGGFPVALLETVE